MMEMDLLYAMLPNPSWQQYYDQESNITVPYFAIP